jgi:hypothetical protein
MTDSNVAATLKLENGQGCRVMTDYDYTPFAEMTCPDGQEVVAYERNGCVRLIPSPHLSASAFFSFLFFFLSF